MSAIQSLKGFTPNAAELRRNARRMQRFPTASEFLLWQFLKARRLGVTFKRQQVIGGYIVDFLCPKLKLIVEVDGGYHAERARADARRDAALGRVGYRVLRLSAELVLAEPRVAAAQVLLAVGERG